LMKNEVPVQKEIEDIITDKINEEALNAKI
jgi:hypothetical protein